MSVSDQISDAEWQIMRTIWEEVPITSSDIYNRLNATTGWSRATVKTFLARLVHKKVLSYEVKGKTRHYYPLISEKTCVTNEMQSVIEKLYGGNKNLETEHFEFKGDHDKHYIEQLAASLEEKYQDITSDLDFMLKDKLSVYTHTSQVRLHSALGLLNGPKWLRAGHTWGILHMAPQKCFDDIKAEEAAVHIMTLMIINQINPSAPYWFQQAVSAYEGKWLTREQIEKAATTYVTNNKLLKMRDMRQDYLSFKEWGGYELSYTVAEFIVQAYSMVALGQLLRNPTNYQGILAVTEQQFWEKWEKFLLQYYVK